MMFTSRRAAPWLIGLCLCMGPGLASAQPARAAQEKPGVADELFSAAMRDDVSGLRTLLLRGADPNVRDKDGNTPLYVALREPALAVAAQLIEYRATQVDARNKTDETPLMMASLRGQLDMVKKLIERGADVNKTGWTPLHYAATRSHDEIVNLLLEEHAYIDAESPNGTTPLMMAAQYGGDSTVKLLLDAGADPSLRNRLGLSAADFAHRAKREQVADLIAAQMRKKQPKGQW